MVATKYIAEIGLNHNGDVDLAKKHILAAKKSGAHFAKFQTYFTEQRAKPGSTIKDILKQCEFSEKQFLELKLFCDNHGIEFASTAFCCDSVDLLHSIGCVNVKVASFQISNNTLLTYLRDKSWIKNLWISTGMATYEEICNAISIFQGKTSSTPGLITFMHCVSQYPVKKISDYQLNNITHLAQLSGTPAGYSDHTLGFTAALIATALGTSFIEKHFTIDNDLEGADHAMSADPIVFSQMVSACNECLDIIGSNNRSNPFPCESSCLQFKD